MRNMLHTLTFTIQQEKHMQEYIQHVFLGFEFNIERIEQSAMDNGEKASIIYLVVNNVTSKKRNISLSKATYVTNKGEQIEQDTWLSGYLTQDDVLQPNAYKKLEIIYYANKLKNISNDDTLYFSMSLPKEGTKLTVCFKKESEGWGIVDVDKTDIENQSSDDANRQTL